MAMITTNNIYRVLPMCQALGQDLSVCSLFILRIAVRYELFDLHFIDEITEASNTIPITTILMVLKCWRTDLKSLVERVNKQTPRSHFWRVGLGRSGVESQPLPSTASTK